MALTTPGAADVRVGGETVAKWRFDLIKDETPQHRPHGQPDHDAARRASPSFRASDDHGVASAEARFALAERGSAKRRSLSRPEEPGGKAEADPAARAAARCRCNCRRPM